MLKKKYYSYLENVSSWGSSPTKKPFDCFSFPSEKFLDDLPLGAHQESYKRCSLILSRGDKVKYSIFLPYVTDLISHPLLKMILISYVRKRGMFFLENERRYFSLQLGCNYQSKSRCCFFSFWKTFQYIETKGKKKYRNFLRNN